MPADIPPHLLPAPPLAAGLARTWTGETTVRIYHAGPDRSATTPRTGHATARFDPQVPGSVRSALYAGEAFATAVRETLGRSAQADVCPRRRVAALVPAAGAVQLQDFVAASPADLRAPDDLGDGEWNYDGTQQWARAIHDERPAHTDIAGIRYWSRLDRAPDTSRSGINVVVWETAPALGVPMQGPVRQDFPVRHPPIWARAIHAVGDEVVLRPISSSECGRCVAKR